MPEVISHTDVFCPGCRCTHPARHVRDNGMIIGEVDCPVEPWQTTLSEHAGLFQQFRSQARFDPSFRAPEPRPFFFHYLSLTDDCNCRCPVCYADSGTTETNIYLGLEEAGEIARNAVARGAGIVVLVGGEPTLHPRLEEIVTLLRRFGLKVWLATNGLLLARNPGLAGRLRVAGLEKVSLQLDSFVRETHLAIRGNDFIEEKLEAARLAVAAGLNLGLVCTVTSLNLPELPSYCRQVFSWPDPPKTVVFQGAAHVGRIGIDGGRHITREEIVSSLVAGQAIPGLNSRHFWPIPMFRPLDVYVHPDCAANTVAVITDKGVEPADGYADMDAFLTMVSRKSGGVRSGSRRGYLVPFATKCLRAKGWRLVARHVFERLRRRSGVRIVFIGTGAFLRRDFQDTSRVQRCGSGTLDADGSVSMCAHHGSQPCNGV